MIKYLGALLRMDPALTASLDVNFSDETFTEGVYKSTKQSGVDNPGLAREEGGADGGRLDSKRARGESSGEYTVPEVKNKAVGDLEDRMKALMLVQMRDSAVYVEEGLMSLLKSCLASAPQGSTSVVVSGSIEHFESKKTVDMGWGCGWRNIQMLCSYLFSEDPEISQVLFNGAGFIPDIPALQQWLEIAWVKGFDIPGGEYFDWKVQGTNKWIGTTEGAALLRSFGVRAQIVDFQALGDKRKSRQMRTKTGQAGTDTNEDHGKAESRLMAYDEDDGLESVPRRSIRDEVDVGMECIVCGEHRVQLSQFRTKNEKSDMCPTCLDELRNSGNKEEDTSTNEETTQITGKQREGWDKKTGCGGPEGGKLVIIKHQEMVDWVWKYFTGDTVKTSQTLTLSTRSPLYFQHRGHSQTIVGIERRTISESPDAEEVNLIVLDPSQETMEIVRSLHNNHGWERLVKRGLQTLKQSEYQLCYADRGVAVGEELEKLKILTSRIYTY